MSYEEKLDWLFRQLPMFSRVGQAAYKPGLERSWALARHFGNPQDKWPSIHIAGTNGKGSVSHLIASTLQSQGYKVVRDIGGHGVGLEFHEDPFVSYVTRRDTGMLLVPGMVFTIEPMINLGTDEIFIDSDNDWTVYTEDGAPSAQWEVTVAVTEDGYEILAY